MREDKAELVVALDGELHVAPLDHGAEVNHPCGHVAGQLEDLRCEVLEYSCQEERCTMSRGDAFDMRTSLEEAVDVGQAAERKVAKAGVVAASQRELCDLPAEPKLLAYRRLGVPNADTSSAAQDASARSCICHLLQGGSE